jgi:hypothetical protein
VRVDAAHERQMEQARLAVIVEVAAGTPQQGRVFDPLE